MRLMNIFTRMLLLISMVPLTLSAWKMESQTVSLPTTVGGGVGWTTVTFQQSYTDPLVFAMPTEEPGYPGSVPVVLRIKNVTATSFDLIQLAGTDSGDTDSQHTEMSIHYFVIEKGQHSVDNIMFDAGDIDTSAVQHGSGVSGTKSYDNISYTATFSAEPALLAMIQSVENNGASVDPDDLASPWLSTAVDNVTTTDFDLALERAEVDRGSVTTTERVAYVAMTADTQGSFYDTATCELTDFETMVTSDTIKGWDDGCYEFSFANTYSDTPNVIAKQNSRDGGNGGWLRRCSLNTAKVGLNIDEDQYKDSERKHTTEIGAMVVFEKDFVYDSTQTISCLPPYADFRMDECYWLNGSGGVEGEVRDNSANIVDATTVGSSVTDHSDAVITASGDFSTSGSYVTMFGALNLSAGWTLSSWVKFPVTSHSSQYYIFGSYSGDGDLPVLEISGSSISWGIYDNSKNYSKQVLSMPSDGWHLFTFVDDGTSTDLYIDGTYDSSIALTTQGLVEVLLTSTDDYAAQTISTQVDEYKIWTSVLGADEIKAVYDNESSGKNYDGTTRETTICGASTTAGGWQLIGIPAEARASKQSITFGDVFNELPAGSYADNSASDGWILFKPLYNATVNLTATNGSVALGDNVEFGTAYWLLTKAASSWDTDDLLNVDYDISKNSVPECGGNRCVKIAMQETMPEDPTYGPYRYTMFGFVGREPVDWADCKIVVTDSGGSSQILTIEDANSSDYISREIWYWSGGTGGAADGHVRSTDYSSCSDISLGGCKLVPHQGYWIRTQQGAVDHTVEILLPKGVDQ